MNEVLFDHFITTVIILSLVVIFYCKITNRTITDLINDLREAFSSPVEEIPI